MSHSIVAPKLTCQKFYQLKMNFEVPWQSSISGLTLDDWCPLVLSATITVKCMQNRLLLLLLKIFRLWNLWGILDIKNSESPSSNGKSLMRRGMKSKISSLLVQDQELKQKHLGLIFTLCQQKLSCVTRDPMSPWFRIRNKRENPPRSNSHFSKSFNGSRGRRAEGEKQLIELKKW